MAAFVEESRVFSRRANTPPEFRHVGHAFSKK